MRVAECRRLIAGFLSTTLLAIVAFTGSAAARGNGATGEITPGPTISGNYLAARHARVLMEENAAADFLLAALKQAPDEPALLMRALPALLLSGRVTEAIAIAERIRGVSNTNPAELTLAVHDIHQKRYAEAMRRLTALPPAPHTDIVVSLLIAWSEWGAGNVEAALRRLEPVDGKRGLSNLNRVHAAWLTAAAGRAEPAADAIEKVLQDHPEPWLRLVELGGGVLERAGRREAALALYRDYTARRADSDILAAAIARAEAGKPPPLEVRTAEDGAAESLSDAAGILRQQNARETALILARLGLYLRPDFPSLQMLVGDLLDDFNRHRDANRVYASIAVTSPLVVPAQLSQARNLEKLDRFDEAQAILQEMARQRPNDDEPLAELGDMYRKRERYADAVVAYDQAFARIPEILPQHWRLLYVRGIALERTKDWPRAEADFLKALEFEPDQPAVLNYLGYSWVEQGLRLGDAEAMIRKAVELRPNDGYIIDSLGWVLFRLGRADEAVEYLEKAVELRPEDPVINDHLGDVYRAVGRNREAVFQWTAALKLDPEPELKAQIEAKLGRGGSAQAETRPE